MPLLPLIIQYRHYLGYGMAVIAVLACLWYIKHIGYKECVQDQIVKTVKIVEKRNEIANRRPSDAVTINRLRNGTF